MKQLSMLRVGSLTTSLNSWKAMPKASKTPEGYTLKVNGAEVKSPQVQLTGGGAFPAYTYLQVGEDIKWFAGHFESGTAVEIIDPTSAAAKVEVAPAAATEPVVPATPVEPTKPKSNKKK